jgi:hypothetical protein
VFNSTIRPFTCRKACWTKMAHPCCPPACDLALICGIYGTCGAVRVAVDGSKTNHPFFAHAEFWQCRFQFTFHRNWNMAPDVLTAVQFKYGGCTCSLCGLVCC